MSNFNYGQVIEYIDGTRDLNFEAARRWAKEHNTLFTEIMDRREYRNVTVEEEEEYITDDGQIKKDLVLKDIKKMIRYFQIGTEPKPKPITLEQKKTRIKNILAMYIDMVAWRVQRYQTQTELEVNTTDSHEEYVNILQYMEYCREYDSGDNQWWEKEPQTYEEWKKD